MHWTSSRRQYDVKFVLPIVGQLGEVTEFYLSEAMDVLISGGIAGNSQLIHNLES